MDSNFQTLKPSLQNSIEKVIEKAKFQQCNVEIKHLTTLGDNFFGKLYEIDIKGTTAECEKEINLFVKEKIILKKLKALNTDQLYANEELVYKEISKLLTSLQDEAKIPPEDRYKIAMAYDETSKDAIILENLCIKGFKTYNKTEPVPLKFFDLAVQELAKFHALSFVMELKLPDFFKEKIVMLENSYHFDEDTDALVHKTCKYMADLCDSETKIKIENFVPILLEKLPKYAKDKTNKCTLSHGDYKKSNIMFRMNNGEPMEVIPVDYQFIDYGCPIRDLLYLIFSGTDQEFRRKQLNYLKELYFQTLSRFLKYFHMDVETVYPRKEFERVYTEWLDYGLMIVIFGAIVLFAPDTGLDIENCCSKELPFYIDKKFDNILRGLVDDFVQWGYL